MTSVAQQSSRALRPQAQVACHVQAVMHVRPRHVARNVRDIRGARLRRRKELPYAR